MTVILWCFNHEMNAALAFRAEHPDWTVRIRNVRNIGPDDVEHADRVFAGTYCYGRVAKTYGATPVEEVWLPPDYRHEVHESDGGFRLFDLHSGEAIGDLRQTAEEAWAILDEMDWKP